jgi:hypothetical protein
MNSFAQTCWDWSAIKVEITTGIEKISEGFAGDPAKVEVYVDQIIGEAEKLADLKADLIHHSRLPVCLTGQARPGVQRRRYKKGVSSSSFPPPAAF